MRQLSKRALTYLQKLTRDKDAIVDRQQIEQYFRNQEVPIFEAVVNYGIAYSGYTFNSKTKKSDSFSSFLVCSDDIKLNRKFDLEKRDDIFLFNCGQHPTAQFQFFIDQKGQFYSDGYSGANILSSCFEVEVEQYAYKDEISDWTEHPYFYKLNGADALQVLLTSDFDRILECTDSYNGWFSNNNIIIQKGIWLHEQSSYLHIYGKTDGVIDKLVSDLKKNNIINSAG